MNSLNKFIIISLMMTTSMLVFARDRGWSSSPISVVTPLEIKVGIADEGITPDMLTVILSNVSQNNNQISAITIRAPYDGTDISSPTIIDTGSLFSLGDICTEGSTVLVPYIKDFDVKFALNSGLGWSTFTLADSLSNNFDNADCATTDDGMVLLGHNFDLSLTEIYLSSNSGVSFSSFTSYDSLGPFDGGIRESISTTTSDGGVGFATTVSQAPSGVVRTTGFSTDLFPPLLHFTDIETLPIPMGFTFVKEIANTSFGDYGIFTYNSEGTAKMVQIPTTDPANFSITDLGPINNTGSQFNFQGGAILGIRDLGDILMEITAVWNDFFSITNLQIPFTISTDSMFPLAGVGGPIDGCVVHQYSGDDLIDLSASFAGPRVGSAGTDLHVGTLFGDPIFIGRFDVQLAMTYQVDCQ
jgi:hypothetical protein